MTLNTTHNPLDPQDSAIEEPSIPEEQSRAEAQASEADPHARLAADLEAARAESEQWRDRFLRKAAEFENFRKRSERERAESATLTKSAVLIEFLPIMDACERALKSFSEGDDQPGRLQSYREGVELLYKQLGDTLARLGVIALEAKGRKFDPHMHEALVHLETPEHEDNTVVEELRRGYLLKERLLRPAQVVVASSPKPKKDDDPDHG
jgi:molecular chaperone GrpE